MTLFDIDYCDVTSESRDGPLLDNGSLKTRIRDEWARSGRGTVGDGDLYSVRLEVITGGHIIDSRDHSAVSRHW
jgi:hypothetical protein